jgi:hypothetical protein
MRREAVTKLETLYKKRSKLQKKIIELEADIKKKKKSNAELLAKNIHKHVKPASLTTQRRKITELSLAVEEHQNALDEVNHKIAECEEKEKANDLQAQLKAITENSAQEQSLYGLVNSLITEIQSIIAQIEKHQRLKSHPLRAMITLADKVGVDTIRKLNFDIESFLEVWHRLSISYQLFDPAHCQKVFAQKMDLVLELQSKAQGKRGFSRYQQPVAVQKLRSVPVGYAGRNIAKQQDAALEAHRRSIKIRRRFTTTIHK